MPRTPLPIGAWGEISTRTMKTNKNRKPVKHLSPHHRRSHPPEQTPHRRRTRRTNEPPDLVTFMLGTGVRIGEALAVLWNRRTRARMRG
jgi:hypothetical protein